MTLFNKAGREFNKWLDKNLDGWRGHSFLWFVSSVVLCSVIAVLFIVSASLKGCL